MKTSLLFLLILFLPLLAMAEFVVETPNGVRRLRYQICDENQVCRTVEQTVSYPVCDEHHNCRTVDAFEAGKARIWEEEELIKSGGFVFSGPVFQ